LWGNSYCTYHVAAPIIPLALDTGTAGSPVKITASGDGGCVHRGGSTYDFNFTVSGHTQDSSYHGTFLAFVEESSVTFRVPAASYPAANYHDSFDGLGGAASCAAGFASAMSNAMGRANAWAAGEQAVIATKLLGLEGRLSYIQLIDGSWLVNLQGEGTGHLAAETAFMGPFAGPTAWQWEATWKILEQDPATLLVAGKGNSLGILPTL
ncbi:MAG: hypothetical protein LC623_09960, partial [Halobacteriales archaeon]|nr:hypothetical protein [Halobacteriales archaeon]